jgi:hypothetical protein
MLLGGLWRLNDRFTWMSMSEIRVNAATPVLEEKYWAVFPSKCLRFWPMFIRKSQDVAVFLERTNPVLVKTRMTGIGSFAVDIDLLSPRIVVEWKGELWCISKEGRMWNLADGSLGLMDLKVPQKPVWRVIVSSVINENEQLMPRGVFPSIFSIDAIDDFLDGLRDAPWFGGVEEVVLDRRAGDYLFKLRYVRDGKDFAILIQSDKYEWEELSLALEQILADLAREDGSRLIDATYWDERQKQNKIVVRDLPADMVEGSARE